MISKHDQLLNVTVWGDSYFIALLYAKSWSHTIQPTIILFRKHYDDFFSHYQTIRNHSSKWWKVKLFSNLHEDLKFLYITSLMKQKVYCRPWCCASAENFNLGGGCIIVHNQLLESKKKNIPPPRSERGVWPACACTCVPLPPPPPPPPAYAPVYMAASMISWHHYSPRSFEIHERFRFGIGSSKYITYLSLFNYMI